MTKTEILGTFRDALTAIGYEETRICEDYEFSDLTAPTSPVKRIPLAAFAVYPHSYRSARVGVILEGEGAQLTADEFRALGAPLLMTVRHSTVQPWASGVDGAKAAGRSFDLKDTKRAFKENQDSWKPEAFGRVKAVEVDHEYQKDLFDSRLVSVLEEQFQTKLKELLESTFKDIALAYKSVHGRAPKVSALFGFLFRFITAKIFMDRADAQGWKDLKEPLDILKAAEKQTGLLDRPESDFRRRGIIDTAWSSISRNLHFQNLSVPDLAFVAESAFITEHTRNELGVHSTPAGLADYIVNQLPWKEVALEQRTVLEPFCGHGIFLAKAMERLGQDLSSSLSPKERHEYFRQRLTGIETDPLSLEICRVVLTLSDYPNDNSWQLHHEDVFRWVHWEKTLQSTSVVLANPPYEAFTKTYRRNINATKTKPPAEFLRRLLEHPPRLLGLVLPQSFLTDPIYHAANRCLARNYDSISVVELPRIFRYANNETVALIASGLRTQGEAVRISYSEVKQQDVEQFLEDWRVSEVRQASIPVPPSRGGPRFTLRLLPKGSVFGYVANETTLGKLTQIHKGVNWIARSDGKPMTAPRTDVASDKDKKGYRLGAEKMNGNLSQFQLKTLRYLSLLDKDQDPSTKANRRPWEERKTVCNAARFQPLSPWRLAAWGDANGLAFTKQFFAIWPKDGVSELAIAAVLSSPVANAFSFERDLERHNHIETLLALPVPKPDYLKPGGEIHRRASELQALLEPRDFVQPPTEAVVMEAVLRLDALVLDAYELSPSLQIQLLKRFNGWQRPLPPPYNQAFTRYFPDHFQEEVTLSELLAITIDWGQTSKRKTDLIERKIQRKATGGELAQLARLKFLTEARGEYFAPLPIPKLTQLQEKLKSQNKWEDD